MANRLFRFIIMLPVLIYVAIGTALAKDTVSPQSFVIFNTKCARCHEGQCSSRMCFQQGPGAANTHIRKNAGEVTDDVVGELYNALHQMKVNCAYCASPFKAPENGIWSKENIRLLSLSSRQGIFIPLGKLKPAKYALRLTFEKPTEFQIEILSQKFEPIMDERISHPDADMSLIFEVEETFEHYLRIRSKTPLIVNSLALKKSGR